MSELLTGTFLIIVFFSMIRSATPLIFAALGGFRKLQVVRGIAAGVDLRSGMQPGRDVMTGRVKMNREAHLLPAVVPSLRTHRDPSGLLKDNVSPADGTRGVCGHQNPLQFLSPAEM